LLAMVPSDLLRIVRQSEPPEPLRDGLWGSRLTVASHADASQVDDRSTRAYASRERANDVRVFRAARRHSRLVRLLRIAVPVTVVVAVLITVLSVYVLDPLRQLAKLPGSIGGLVVSGTSITMQQPRMSGFTQDRRPYVVTARAATQDVTKPDTVQLLDLNATIEFKDAGKFELTARSGLFESKQDRLTLQDDILVNSAAYQAKLSEAVVNVRTNHMVSEHPVEVTMKQGTVNANRLEVTNSGEVIRFEGGVTMVLVPENDRSGEKSASR
jgi:lipopolysaccharide export system protein LptC